MVSKFIHLAIAAGGLALSGAASAEALKGGEVAMFVGTGYPMQVPPQITDPAFQAEVLAAHNRERNALGIPSLAWSADLAEEAQDWANELASTGVMQHNDQRRHGENLWFNGLGRRTPSQMIQGWLDEKQWYIPGGPQPNTSTTGNWVHVGHYTAIVWSATTSIGCAIGRGAKSDFLVCRYDPIGNVVGYAAYDAAAAQKYIAANAAAAASAGTAKASKKKK